MNPENPDPENQFDQSIQRILMDLIQAPTYYFPSIMPQVWILGSNEISNKDQTYFARAQTYRNPDGSASELATANYVQVSDLREPMLAGF